MNLSLTEMLAIGVVALLLYGGRLPELMRTLGHWAGKLRRAYDDLQHEIRREAEKLDDAVRSDPAPDVAGSASVLSPSYPGTVASSSESSPEGPPAAPPAEPVPADSASPPSAAPPTPDAASPAAAPSPPPDTSPPAAPSDAPPKPSDGTP